MPPNLVTALHFDNSVFKPHVFQHNVILKKEPIGDANPYLPGKQQRVLLLIFYQNTLQVHVVEQGKVDMFYFNFGPKVFG